ncbi:MAG: GTPase Era [Fibrobacter sp.]|jgi:GTP-binding protein Era|nr:GTPase Era [Fibrobacter sp.]
MEQKSNFKSAFIALVGRPNSGKSTLMNTILGEQLSVVTPLPQTTRKNLRGILTTDDMQLIFVDTPGVHKGDYTFNDSMVKETVEAISKESVDLICYIVDLSRSFGEEEATVGDLVKSADTPVIIIFNKADTINTPEKIIRNFFDRFPRFKETSFVKLSAIRPESKEIFLQSIAPFIPEGPMYFPSDELTDSNLRFFASEYIRKQIILNTREEVPHASFVEIESYRESSSRHDISATIHVETTGQRGIIVGKGGAVIKKIRRGAESEMEKLTGVPVKISCHVKVSPGWRDNDLFLKSVGMPR